MNRAFAKLWLMFVGLLALAGWSAWCIQDPMSAILYPATMATVITFVGLTAGAVEVVFRSGCSGSHISSSGSVDRQTGQ